MRAICRFAIAADQLPDAINLKINLTFSQLRSREPRMLKQLLAEFNVTFFHDDDDDDKRYDRTRELRPRSVNTHTKFMSYCELSQDAARSPPSAEFCFL